LPPRFTHQRSSQEPDPGPDGRAIARKATMVIGTGNSANQTAPKSAMPGFWTE